MLTFEVEALLPPLESYDFERVYGSTYDELEGESSKILRIAIWLLGTDMLVTYGAEANYVLESTSWPESLLALLTLAGSVAVSGTDVIARFVVENKVRIEDEQEEAVPILHQQEEALAVLLEKRDKRRGQVDKAPNPTEQKRHQDLLDNLEVKVSNSLAKTTSLRETVKVLRAWLAWYQHTYREEEQAEMSVMEVERQPPSEQAMEVPESASTPPPTQPGTPQPENAQEGETPTGASPPHPLQTEQVEAALLIQSQETMEDHHLLVGGLRFDNCKTATSF